MTGRDLILYILKNHLEDEPVFRNGTFVGFIPIDEAAAKLEVGFATVFALMSRNELDYISIGNKHYISDMQDLKRKGV